MKDSLSQKDVETVLQVLAHELGVTKTQLTGEAHFEQDLGADSLSMVKIIMELEEHLEISIPDESAEKVKTVGDLFELLGELLQALRR